MKKRIRVNGIIIFVTVVVILLFSNFFFDSPASGLLKKIKEVFGLGFILLGQLIRISSRGYKSENSKNGHVLIKGGPYKLVRHPMYLGIILIGFGIVLMLFKWWVAAGFFVIFSLRYITLIIKEESNLAAYFPEDYRIYKSEVPRRIFPAAREFFTSDIRRYLPLKKEWISREFSSVSAVLTGVLAVNVYQYIRKDGIVLYFGQALMILSVMAVFFTIIKYLETGQKDVSVKS